jgi:N-formylmaleamate deformylase
MLPAHWTEGDLTINDGSLHYLRTGNGSKPSLVLVHGFSDNSRCWLQTAIDLEGDYDIIMPDARGHGLSARVKAGEPVDLVADLAGIIQALDLRHPIIGGHSMGAMTAYQLGSRYPEIPRALILEDPPWRESDDPAVNGQPTETSLAERVEVISRTSLDELIAEARLEHPAWPDSVINTWCPAKKQLDVNFVSALRLNQTDWPESVPLIACPTLIVIADTDRGGIVSPAVAARVQALNSRCAVVHIPGTGHHVRFEVYDAYMNHVTAFLQDNA